MNNNNESTKKEYLTLVQEYHQDADDTLAILREDMGIGQDDDELSRARRT